MLRGLKLYVDMVFYHRDILFQLVGALDDRIVFILLFFEFFKPIDDKGAGFALRDKADD